MEDTGMRKIIRKFTGEEKARYITEYRELQETNNITLAKFAERAGLSRHTLSNWLYYNGNGNNPCALVKVGNAAPLPVATSPPEVRIEYFNAVIRTDLNHLASVLRIIRNA
jgi:transposase-like protein